MNQIILLRHRSQMKSLLTVLLFFILSSMNVVAQTTFYSKVSPASFNTLTNWSSTADGTGPAPIAANRTSGLCTFVVQDGHTASVDVTTLDLYALQVGTTGAVASSLQYSSASNYSLLVRNTITIGSNASFTLATGGTARTHTLSCYGSIINNGILDLNDFSASPAFTCSATFLGASNATISGTGSQTDFYSITVNKGNSTASTLEATLPFTLQDRTVAGTNLTLTNGTFKLSSASVIQPYYGGLTIASATAKLHINNPGAVINSSGAAAAAPYTYILTGGLQLTAGTMNLGNGNDILNPSAATSILTVDGGTLNVNGSITFATNVGSQFAMSSGRIIIDPQGTDFLASGTSILWFGSNHPTNAAVITGGTITIIDPHSAYNATGLSIGGTPLATAGLGYNFSGATFIFGDGVSTSAGVAPDGFKISTGNLYPLGNVVINNPAANAATRSVKLMGNSTIGGNLTITNAGGSQFNANGFTLSLKGNLLNNGSFNTSTAASALTMNGISQQVISGSGTFTDGATGSLRSLTVDNSSGASPAVDLQANIAITAANSVITLANGELGSTTANTLSIGAGAASTITTTRANGSMTVPVYWNLPNVTYNVNYNPSVAPQTTGNELPLPADGAVDNITVNNASGVLLGAADLTVEGIMTLTNGAFDASGKTVNFITSVAPFIRNGTTQTGTFTTNQLTTLNFGTASALTGGNITIPANTFTYNPTELNDLSINKSASHSLSWNNQNLTLYGTLTLNLTGAAKTFAFGNRLTFVDDDEPVVRTSGTLTTTANTIVKFGDVGHTAGAAFVLPAGLFTANPSIAALQLNRDNKLTLGNQPFTLSGTLVLEKGELDNNGLALTLNGNVPVSRTSGTLTMGSTSALVFAANANAGILPDDLFTSSPTSISAFTINRAGGITMNNQELNVTGTTTLTSGLVSLAGSDFQIGTSPVVTAGSMFVTSGTGSLKHRFAPGATAAYIFPVGDANGTVEYSPYALTMVANTAADTIKVRVTNAKHPLNAATDNYINRYWSVSAPSLSTYTYSATMTYPAADVVGADEANFKMNRHDGSSWITDPASFTAVGTHVLATGNLNETSGDLNGNDFTSSYTDVYYYSRASGNWNGGVAVWEASSSATDPGVGNGSPTAVVPTYSNCKGITIRNGHNIALNAATYTADQLTVETGGTLTMGANSLTLYNGDGTDISIKGTLSTTAGQLVSSSAGVAIDIYGTFQTSDADGFSGTVNTSISNVNTPVVSLAPGSTVDYNNGSQSVTGEYPYKNLKIYTATTKTAKANIIVDESLSVAGGTFELAGYDLTVAGTTSLTGYLSDNNLAGTNTLQDVSFLGGGMTSSIADDFIVNGDISVTGGNGTIGLDNLTVLGTTTVAASKTLTLNSALGTKSFNDIVINGVWTNPGNTPVSINGDLLVNAGATFNAGTGAYTFAGANKSIGGTAATIPTVDIAGTYTNTMPSGLNITALLTGAGKLIQGPSSVLQYSSAAPISIANLDAASNVNTVNYNGAAQPVYPAVYSNLILSVSGVKTATGSISASSVSVTGNNTDIVTNSPFTVSGDFASSITAGTMSFGGNSSELIIGGNLNINNNTFELGNIASQPKTVSVAGSINTLAGTIFQVVNLTNTHIISAGAVANTGTFDLYQSSSANADLTLNLIGDATLGGWIELNNLTLASNAVSQKLSLGSNFTIQAKTSIQNNNSLDLNGKTLKSLGNITIANGGELDVVSTAGASSQLLMGSGKSIDNSGVLKVVGNSSCPAIVDRAAGYYFITQSAPSAIFHAKHYQFNYLNGPSGGITLSDGSIDNTDNFSDGIFQLGSGNQYLNLDGLDLTSLSTNCANVKFVAGPTYNVRKTSGLGAIRFDDSQGTLSGENFDVDNGQPGSLVQWTYPALTYYSQGTGMFGNLSNWNKNQYGGGASPAAADLLSGLAVFVVQNGHTVTVDGNYNVLAMQVGTGASGSLVLGNNTTARNLTINTDLTVQNGALVAVGSSNAIHAIYINGNVINNGSVNLYANSTRNAATTFGGKESFILGANTPVFGSLTVKGFPATLTTKIPIEVDGSVNLLAGAVFNTGAFTHTVWGDWSSAGTHNSTGTIEFDGSVSSTINTAATFNNVSFRSPTCIVAGSPLAVSGRLSVDNGAMVTIGGTNTVTVQGDIQIEGSSSMVQTGGTFTLDGTNPQIINAIGALSLNNLIVSNGTINPKQFTGAISAALLTVNNTATIAGDAVITLTNGALLNGKCLLSNNLIVKGGTIQTSDISNTISLGTAKLSINGTVNLAYTLPATACTLVLNNDVDITAGQLILANNSFLKGTGHQLSVAPASSIRMRGADNFPVGFDTCVFALASNAIYDGNLNQTVRGGNNLVYSNLTLGYNTVPTASVKTADAVLHITGNLDYINNSVATKLSSLHDITISGNVTNIGASVLEQIGGTTTFNGDAPQILNTGTYSVNTIIFTTTALSGSISKTIYPSAITINGDFLANNIGGDDINLHTVNLTTNSIAAGATSKFTVESNTIVATQAISFKTDVLAKFHSRQFDNSSTILYNAAAAQDIADIPEPYGNLTFDGNYAKTATGPLNIDGTFRTLNSSVFYDGGFSHCIAKNWNVGTGNYTPISALGTIVFDGTDQQISASNFRNVSFAGTDTKKIIGNITVLGNVKIENGSTFDGDLFNITLHGNWINTGTGRFIHNDNISSNGTVYFVNSALQTVQNIGGYFNHININKSYVPGQQSVRFVTDVDIRGNVTVTDSTAVLDLSGVTARLGGRLSVYENPVETGRNFIADGSTVIFSSPNTQYIYTNHAKPLHFNNISFEGTGDKYFGCGTVPLAADTVIVDGNWNITGSQVFGQGWNNSVIFRVRGDWNNSGAFSHNRTVFFDGTDQSISASSFNNANFEGGGTKILTGNITLVGSGSISSGSTLDIGTGNNTVTVGGNWINNGIFVPRNGTVIFNGNSGILTTGGSGFAQPGKTFYNILVNKAVGANISLTAPNSDLVVENDFTIGQGGFNTNGFNMWIGGNFVNTSSNSFTQSPTSILTLNAAAGSKNFIPGSTSTFSNVKISPSAGVRYSLGSTFNVNQDFIITDGYFDLNAKTMNLRGNNVDVIIQGGTFDVDTAAVVSFANTNQSILNAGGTLKLVGSAEAPAQITKSGGTFTVKQTSGTFHARNYIIDQGSGVILSGGTIDPANNFSNGAYTAGVAGTTYLTLDNFPIDNSSNLLVENVVFGTGAARNVKRTVLPSAPGNGYIELQDASGGLVGAAFETDDASAATGNVRWTYPDGYLWVGLDVTDPTDWHRPANWAGGQVPPVDAKVSLNHQLKHGAYTVNIKTASVTSNRINIVNEPANGIITLQLQNGFDLSVVEGVNIGLNTVLTATDNTNLISIGKDWSNAGTFNHGNSTVLFNGITGIHSISSGGAAVGKRFYNLKIDALSTTYTLAQSLKADGDLTITSGTLDANNYDITVGGNWLNTGLGVFVPTSRTVSFDGGNQSIEGGPFYNFTVSNAGTKSFPADMTILGTLTLSSGIINASSKTIYVGGSWVNSGGTLSQSGMGGVEFNGVSGTQLVDNGSHTTAFNNITMSNNATKVFYKNSTVAGDFLITSNSGWTNVRTMNVSGIGTNNSFANYGLLAIEGANNFPSGFETVTLAQNSTVRYQSDAAQTIAPIPYGNLDLRRISAGTTTKTAGGHLVVTGSLSLSDAFTTLNTATNDVNITLTGNLGVAPGATIIWGTGSSTLFHVGGDWGIDADITSFNNLYLQGTGTKYQNSNLTVTGDISVKNGVTLRMAAWNSNSDHFQINCTGSGKDFQLQDGATLVNITPSASGPAFPTNFATYSIGANSFVYLNSPDGVGQTLFSLPSYGNLVFGNRKSVISDGLNDLRCNGYFNMYRSSYLDGGKDIYLAGTPNCITNYSPSTSARKLVLNGASQVIYDYDADPANQDNKLLLANVEFSNSGTKTLGDGNDTIAITQSLKVASGVTVTCNRPIDFYGNAWTDDGDFQHSSNTLSFSNTSPLIIKPGRNNHFFNTITFNSAGAKTFVTRGADINGSIILNAGTVDFGSLTHKIAGNVSNTAGDVASSSTDFIFDGNGQSLQFMNGSTFSAHDVNITTAATTNQTKVMGNNWSVANLTIDPNATLDASVSNFNLNLTGNWTNNGNFYGRGATVAFNAASASVSVFNPSNGQSNNGLYNFNVVQFKNAATFNLLASSTTILNNGTVGLNAILDVASNTLIVGSNLPSGKSLSVAGTLHLGPLSFLKLNNTGSPVALNVTGTLKLVGSSLANPATITRQNVGGHTIDIASSGTVEARYYLIDHMAASGFNMAASATLHPINNFSDGTWSNILNAPNATYLQLDNLNYTGGLIQNLTFNCSFAPIVGTHFNVKRPTSALPVVEFGVVSGTLGGYLYENDNNSATSGSLLWPSVTDVVWTGNVDNEWENPLNWMPNFVPTIAISAVIPSVSNNPIISTADARCLNLKITNGSLLLKDGYDISIGGDVIIGTGTSTASLIVASPTSEILAYGNWSRGANGIFVHGSSTVRFLSNAGSVNVQPRTSNFYNIEFNNENTTFNLANNIINIKGSLTITKGTVSPSVAGYVVNLDGDYINNGGVFSSATVGAISFNSGNQAVYGGTFYRARFKGTGTKMIYNGMSVADSLLVTSYLKAAPSSVLDMNGPVTIAATGTFDDGNETHLFAGNRWTGTGQYIGSGSIVFDAPAAINQDIYGGKFNILEINSNAYARLFGDVTVQNDFLVLGSTLRFEMRTFSLKNANDNGQCLLAAGKTLYVSGANNFPARFSTYELDPSSTVRYDGTLNQYVAPVTYGNVLLFNANTKTLAGDVIIKGNLNFSNSTLDVSPNNYSITAEGAWTNNSYPSLGTFKPRKGVVTFSGSVNQLINISPSTSNPFFQLNVDKQGGAILSAPSNADLTISNSLNIYEGVYNPNNRISYIGQDLNNVGGSVSNNGTFFMNKSASGTAYIHTNGSTLYNLAVSTPLATVQLTDALDVYQNFELLAGTFDAQGFDNLFGWWNNAINISGTYKVGAGGFMRLSGSTKLSVLPGGTLELVGMAGNLATLTQGRNLSNYAVQIDGTVKAKYYQIEYIDANGVQIKSAGIIDSANNFSYGTFTKGVNNGTYLNIENAQDLYTSDSIVDVSFPVRLVGTGSNVFKSTANGARIKFYNSTGEFAGEPNDNDPNNLVDWTGPIALTWNGSVDKNWYNPANWTASNGAIGLTPKPQYNVIIAATATQPEIHTTGNTVSADTVVSCKNLTIASGASLKVSTLTDSVDMLIYGDIYINGQFNMASDKDLITVMGNWSKSASGTVTTQGTVKFLGADNTKTINNGTASFYNVDIEGTATFQIGSSMTVRNNMNILSGTFDVTNNNLSVGGNLLCDGAFLGSNGTVTLMAASGTKYIRIGTSSFNNLKFNDGSASASSAVYKLMGDVSVNGNITLDESTLDINGYKLSFGDNVGSDFISVNGTLLLGSGSTLSMSNNSSVAVNTSGLLKLAGAAGNEAKITRNAAGSYGIIVNSGGVVSARNYIVEYLNTNGMWFKAGSLIDPSANLSSGVFSNGAAGGTYLKLENTFTEGVDGDTLRDITFDVGPAYNVTRSSGTGAVVFKDAEGNLGGYAFENDDASPYTGRVQWAYKYTIARWTGAADSDWSNPLNWIPSVEPDSATIVDIPDLSGIGGFPCVIDNASGNAKARKINIFKFASLALKDGKSLSVYSDMNNQGVFTVTGASAITVDGSWSNTGTFVPSSSTVRLVSASGKRNIMPGTGGFYNLDITGGAEYKLAANTAVINNLGISAGSLDVSVNNFSLSVGKNFTNAATFIPRSGTVLFNGNTAQSVSSSSSFYNVSKTLGTGKLYLNSDIDINNDFVVSKAGIDGQNHTISLAGKWAFSGSAVTAVNTSVVFDGTATKTFTTGSNVSFINFSINKTAASDIILNSNISISGVLKLTSGNLVMNGKMVSLSGTADNSGTGTLTGSPASTLTIDGSGSFGSIAFTPGAQLLRDLNVNRSAAGSAQIGSNLSVYRNLTLGAGTLDLSGNTISLVNSTVPNSITRGNGSFSGGTIVHGALVDLVYNGSISALTGIELPVAATVLRNLSIINPNGVTLSTSSTCNGLLTLGAGTLNFSDQSLTLNGTMSAASGLLGANRNSALTINGAAVALGAPLNFALGLDTLGTLSNNRVATITLASNLAVSDLVLNVGVLALSANKMYEIYGTTTYGTGVINGINTASLVFSGTASKSLKLGATAAARSLRSLTCSIGSGDLLLETPVSLASSLYLTKGIVKNDAVNQLSLANNATIYRSQGTLAAAPIFTTGVNIQYTNLSDITTAYEMPAGASILKNLTVNCGMNKVVLAAQVQVNTSLNLISGYIDAVTNNTYLYFVDNATSNPGNAHSFVIGSVRKLGNDAFIFPLGDIKDTAVVWAPLGIAAPASAAAIFDASYNYRSISATLGINPNRNAAKTNMQAGLHHASDTEYWLLDRIASTSAPAVTLFWKDNIFHGITELSDLTMAHWNASASKWEKMTVNNASVTGTLAEGSIVSDVAFTSYSPITLASEDGSNPLPVELVKFYAAATDTAVSLSWTTLSETNNDYFVVERSYDGLIFESVGLVDGAGSSTVSLNYSFTDKSPVIGVTYYRLKQVDYDGAYEYSDVKSVRRTNSSSENFALGVYPTVAQSINEVELVAAGCRPGDSFEIVLINSIGIEIGKTVVDVSADGEVRLVPFASLTVPSGIYTLAVETGSLRHFKSVIIR